MFKWNPFARESQPAPQPEPAASQAEGFILSSVSDKAIPAGELIVARPIAGLRDDEMMQTWRGISSEHGVTEAYWFNLIIPECCELRYSFAVGWRARTIEKDAQRFSWRVAWKMAA